MLQLACCWSLVGAGGQQTSRAGYPLHIICILYMGLGKSYAVRNVGIQGRFVVVYCLGLDVDVLLCGYLFDILKQQCAAFPCLCCDDVLWVRISPFRALHLTLCVSFFHAERSRCEAPVGYATLGDAPGWALEVSGGMPAF